MRKSRRERRRARAKTEAKRLRRFEATLDGVLPPKAVVGPIERMWRIGKITDEQFWCATRFAGAFEATLPDSMMRAGSFECAPEGPSASQDRELSRSRLGQIYARALASLEEHEGHAADADWLVLPLRAAAIYKIPLEQIEAALHKRKRWAAESVLRALTLLVDLWAADLSQAHKRASTEGSTLV